MIKTIVTAAAAMLALAAAPAGAVACRYCTMNGISPNGMNLNGLQLNGLQLNGLQLNGRNAQGMSVNGVSATAARPVIAFTVTRVTLPGGETAATGK